MINVVPQESIPIIDLFNWDDPKVEDAICDVVEKWVHKREPSKHVRCGSSFSPEVEKALEWKDYLSLFYVSKIEVATTWPPTCRDDVLEYMKRYEVMVKRLLKRG
ncbi:Feruloyl CoA ortho-hydroxylase 2, partial [Mucuna pruriens]